MAQYPFRRLQVELAKLISSLPAESRLPAEPALARQMGVSRATLREAMRSFEGRGLIRRRQGVGTFVVGQVPVIDSGLEVLESLDTMAGRINLSVSMGELRVVRFPADEPHALALGLKLNEPLIRISRIILTDDHPIAFLVDTLPTVILSEADLALDFTGSVLDLLLKRGMPRLSTSRTEIHAVNASPEVAHALQIQRGDVLLYFVSYLYTASGRVVDYSFSYFLPGYFRFHVNRRVGLA